MMEEVNVKGKTVNSKDEDGTEKEAENLLENSDGCLACKKRMIETNRKAILELTLDICLNGIEYAGGTNVSTRIVSCPMRCGYSWDIVGQVINLYLRLFLSCTPRLHIRLCPLWIQAIGEFELGLGF